MNREKPIVFYVKVDSREILPDDLQRYADHCNYFQHRIIVGRALWNIYKADDEAGPYTLLKAKYLHDVIQKAVLVRLKAALLGQGIIECDGRYIRGEKSFGYRFGPTYRSSMSVRMPCRSSHLNKKIKDKKRKEYKTYSVVHRHLFHWLKRVRFNMGWDGVSRMVDTLVIPDGKVMSNEQIREITRDACRLIHDKEFSLTSCNYGRVHTIITRLLSALREHLWIDGERLVNIDIANSQPLFLGLTIMLDRVGGVNQLENCIVTEDESNECFAMPTQGRDEVDDDRVASSIVTTPYLFTIPFCYHNLPDDLQHVVSPTTTLYDALNLLPNFLYESPLEASNTYTIPFCHLQECEVFEKKDTYENRKMSEVDDFEINRDLPSDDYDLKEYMMLCEAGTLYDDLMDRINWNRSRKQFKAECWFPFLYGQLWIENPLNEVFASDFPTVYHFIRNYKRVHGYEELSRQMQRMESRLVIETVCGRMKKELPEVPIVTIHDSIMTPARCVPLVKQVVLDAFAEIGLKPTLKS